LRTLACSVNSMANFAPASRMARCVARASGSVPEKVPVRSRPKPVKT
jgi:hypothetical protein